MIFFWNNKLSGGTKLQVSSAAAKSKKYTQKVSKPMLNAYLISHFLSFIMKSAGNIVSLFQSDEKRRKIK